MVTLDDNVEWVYDGISESERVEVVEGLLGEMNVGIVAHPENETKGVKLVISPAGNCGAPRYNISPFHNVSCVIYEGIENLANDGYAISTVSRDPNAYIVKKKTGGPAFFLMESNQSKTFW